MKHKDDLKWLRKRVAVAHSKGDLEEKYWQKALAICSRKNKRVAELEAEVEYWKNGVVLGVVETCINHMVESGEPLWAEMKCSFAMGSSRVFKLCEIFGYDPETGKKKDGIEL